MRYADCIVALHLFMTEASFHFNVARGASYDRIWLQDACDSSKSTGLWVRSNISKIYVFHPTQDPTKTVQFSLSCCIPIFLPLISSYTS
jgi:hypothetical protein